ncbi:hypothetical protein GCM10028805_33540 [Spirosoma harenae]
MRGELEKLLLEMDLENPMEQSGARQYFKKLVAHTIRLDQLNNQAQAMIHLASLPALSPDNGKQ